MQNHAQILCAHKALLSLLRFVLQVLCCCARCAHDALSHGAPYIDCTMVLCRRVCTSFPWSFVQSWRSLSPVIQWRKHRQFKRRSSLFFRNNSSQHKTSGMKQERVFLGQSSDFNSGRTSLPLKALAMQMFATEFNKQQKQGSFFTPVIRPGCYQQGQRFSKLAVRSCWKLRYFDTQIKMFLLFRRKNLVFLYWSSLLLRLYTSALEILSLRCYSEFLPKNWTVLEFVFLFLFKPKFWCIQAEPHPPPLPNENNQMPESNGNIHMFNDLCRN